MQVKKDKQQQADCVHHIHLLILIIIDEGLNIAALKQHYAEIVILCDLALYPQVLSATPLL